MAEKNKIILWEVGCEGHVDAWVVAPNWEQATVEAAAFWDVPWAGVAAKCEPKSKTVGAPRNVCCKCGRTYFAEPPLCGSCKKVIAIEEKELKQSLARAYKEGRAV